MRHQRCALVALALSATLATAAGAQGAMRAAPSGRATTEVTLAYEDSAARATAALATIRIDHGQPHLRGRALHTDSLVPYDQPWRTGANDATTLTTDVDLVIGGATIPKGRHLLQTLPSRTGWTLLIQPAPSASPTAAANEPANDVARVELRQSALPVPLESLTFWLIPSLEPGVQRGELRLAWGTVMLATDWSVR